MGKIKKQLKKNHREIIATANHPLREAIHYSLFAEKRRLLAELEYGKVAIPSKITANIQDWKINNHGVKQL